MSPFSAYVVSYYREVTGVRKDMIGFLGFHSFFLECHCLLSTFKANSCSNRKGGLWGLSVPPSQPTYSVLSVTHFPCTSCMPPWTWMHCGSTGILCSWGIMNAYANGWQETTHTFLSPLLSCMLYCLISLHLQNISSNKIIKNFKTRVAEHLTKHQALLSSLESSAS